MIISSASNSNPLDCRFDALKYFEIILSENPSNSGKFFYSYYYMYVIEYIALQDRQRVLTRKLFQYINLFLSKRFTTKGLPFKFKLEKALMEISKHLYVFFIRVYSIYYFAKRKKS